MENSTVVPGLVSGEGGLLVQNQEAELRVPLQDLAGGRQTQDAGPDDDDVVDAVGPWDASGGVNGSSGNCPNRIRRRLPVVTPNPAGDGGRRFTAQW